MAGVSLSSVHVAPYHCYTNTSGYALFLLNLNLKLHKFTRISCDIDSTLTNDAIEYINETAASLYIFKSIEDKTHFHLFTSINLTPPLHTITQFFYSQCKQNTHTLRLRTQEISLWIFCRLVHDNAANSLVEDT